MGRQLLVLAAAVANATTIAIIVGSPSVVNKVMGESINWTAIGAVAQAGATVFAVVAIGFVWWQIRKEGLRHSTDLILTLRNQYNGEMRKLRAEAANDLRTETPSHALKEVLNFFDRIGLLVRRGTLDKKMVWNTFFFAVHRYCCLAEKRIAKQRKDRAVDFRELLYLHKELYDIHIQVKKEAGVQDGVTGKEEFLTLHGMKHIKKPNEQVLKRFIKDEVAMNSEVRKASHSDLREAIELWRMPKS